jgi:chitinase
VQNIVIGYFEAWNLLTRSCAKKTVDFIPVDSLTHLNVAFGYIQPSTYTIYPIPGSSIGGFQSITNLKQKAPGLQIWLSLGGWTYSDNDTDTQQVWGDLASTSEKRQKFIVSLTTFMRQWGFDGVDLDWEYPGAPDRGGSKADTANYVSLVQDIDSYFRTQNTGYGLSFTAPTSYWYLRWFDIGKMSDYVNWINLMTYDLLVCSIRPLMPILTHRIKDMEVGTLRKTI